MPTTMAPGETFTGVKVMEPPKPQMPKVGDIYYSSWGYDQTNIEFYMVTKLVGATMIEVEELESVTEPYNPTAMAGTTWPIEPYKIRTDRPAKYRKKPNANGNFKLESWGRWCFPWDGQKKSCSWYA